MRKAKGVGIGILTGRLEGNGYKPTLHFLDRLYVTDGLKAVRGGVIWGSRVSVIDTVSGIVGDKIKEKYNEIKKIIVRYKMLIIIKCLL